ncbi:MAG: helix-turn-helix transcriptional regulator [Chloroflexi bacterium]|nr:helix-turn-helix transcriptional regulator [Chloroflexota bacterium]
MDFDGTMCPKYQRAVDLLARRWTPLIIRMLLSRPRRFSELRATIPGLSDRLLSERLKEMEEEGIVVRQVYAETPVRVFYSLTAKGRDMERIVAEIQRWADKWEQLPLEHA